MDYMEYSTEYQKVILKEQIKRKISIKETLIGTIKNTDKEDLLEMFIISNDFDGQIAFDEMMLEDLGNDEEFKELIEKDIDITRELKQTAEDRLRELKEQDKDKQQEDEEHDEHLGKSHNSQQNSSLADNEKQEVQYENPISKNRFPVYGSQEYYVLNIKIQVAISIDLLQGIKADVDSCPSPTMLMYMEGKRHYFDDTQELARNIQSMPGCDEELRMLTTEEIKAAQEVKDTVDKYIQQYQERVEQNSKRKDEEESLEEIGDRLHQDDNKKDEEPYRENEGRKEADEYNDEDSRTRKSWELPPEEKNEIQIGAQQIAQDYNEKQTNPQYQIEENVVDKSDISR